MKIAVIGAGLAGLSCVYALLKSNSSYQITLFDQNIDHQASQVAAGLCHPFTSDGLRYCYKAKEALAASYHIMDETQKLSEKPLFLQEGISKIALTNKEKINLSCIPYRFENTSWQKDFEHFETSSGALHLQRARTVFVDRYLSNLLDLCQKLGMQYIPKKVASNDLDKFDIIIYAVGAGIAYFEEAKELNLQFLKGQVLYVHYEKDLPQSIMSKGYIAKTAKKHRYFFGSTYERSFTSPSPDQEKAEKIILEKLAPLINQKKVQVLQCLSGVRVCNPRDHLPIIYKASNKSYFVTALGSRGLLYHGLLGRMLAKAIAKGSDENIDPKFYKIMRDSSNAC